MRGRLSEDTRECRTGDCVRAKTHCTIGQSSGSATVVRSSWMAWRMGLLRCLSDGMKVAQGPLHCWCVKHVAIAYTIAQPRQESTAWCLVGSGSPLGKPAEKEALSFCVLLENSRIVPHYRVNLAFHKGACSPWSRWSLIVCQLSRLRAAKSASGVASCGHSRWQHLKQTFRLEPDRPGKEAGPWRGYHPAENDYRFHSCGWNFFDLIRSAIIFLYFFYPEMVCASIKAVHNGDKYPAG